MIVPASQYQLPDALRGTILEKIVNLRIPAINEAKVKLPADSILSSLDRAPEIRSLKRSLQLRAGIIAEIKRASPSAGRIRDDFDPRAIADEYRKAGAAAISVVTERVFFKGVLEDLASLRWSVRLPLLRKDFIVDPYQILEARLAGADAVLLLAVLHAARPLERLIESTEALGMDALVEVHDEVELERALEAGASLIGVNNRDLKNFQVSLDVSLRLAPGIPDGVIKVTESGLRTEEDIRRLTAAGYRGFLIGESLLRATSPGRALSPLVAALEGP